MAIAYKSVLMDARVSGSKVVVTCDPAFAGKTISCTKSGTTLTQVCPSTSPYTVTFEGLESGTWTISGTIEGQTFTTTAEVQDVSCVLSYGFVWTTWVDTSSKLDSTDYITLDDLLEDEEAIRELMLEHACVDYLSQFTSVTPNLEKVINNDLCAKWINECDYALDTCYDNAVLKAVMDEVDKYGYGEWCLMPQVPIMTANDAPYGTVLFDSSKTASGSPSSDYYKLFSGTPQTVGVTQSVSEQYFGYDFTKPVTLSRIGVMGNYDSGTMTLVVEGSADGTTWNSVSESISYDNSTDFQYFDFTPTTYRYWRINTTKGTSSSIAFKQFQFYAYAPKGNVPVMTANNAPYGTAGATATIASTFDAYHAFDGIVGITTIGWSAGSTANAIVYYKFTNPICPRRFLLLPEVSTGYSASTKTWDIVGSNDGSNWEVLYSGENEDEYKEIVDNIENDNYYLYVGARIKTSYRPNESYSVSKLQFYGRELKVSVPVMSGNTTPYGEASANAYDTTGYYPYLAFTDTASSQGYICWGAAGAQWIEYDFTTEVCVKMFYIRNHYYSNSYEKGYIQAYVNDEWVDISEEIYALGTDAQVFEVANADNIAAKKIRFHITECNYGSSAGSAFIDRLNFFGKDYSQKEFEPGTTKKWLYDHGLELESLTGSHGTSGGQQPIFGLNSIIMEGGSSSSGSFSKIRPAVAIDLIPYDLMRAKAIRFVASKSDIGIEDSQGTGKGNKTVTQNDMPYNIGFDISSIDETNYPYAEARSGANGIYELIELWLE